MTNSSSENAKFILDSHLNIGSKKAVSYLPLNTVKNVLGISIQKYLSMIKDQGNESLVLLSHECCINSGAIYAYDTSVLQKILKENEKILSANNWPVTPEKFIRRMASEWLEEGDPVLSVIRKVFGDPAREL